MFSPIPERRKMYGIIDHDITVDIEFDITYLNLNSNKKLSKK